MQAFFFMAKFCSTVFATKYTTLINEPLYVRNVYTSFSNVTMYMGDEYTICTLINHIYLLYKEQATIINLNHTWRAA